MQEDLTPTEREIEQALRTLRPQAPVLDPGTIAFRFGQQSLRRRLVAWRAIAAALALFLAGSWAWSPSSPRRGGATAHDPVRTAADAAPRFAREAAPVRRSPAGGAYLHLRQAVLTRGVDAIPEARDTRSARMDDVLRVARPPPSAPAFKLPAIDLGTGGRR